MGQEQQVAGASATPSGSREPDPSCTGSGPSGFDPSRDGTCEPLIVRVARIAHARHDKAAVADLSDEMAEHADRDLCFYSLVALALNNCGLVLRRVPTPEDNADAIAIEAAAAGETPKDGSTEGESAGRRHRQEPSQKDSPDV